MEHLFAYIEGHLRIRYLSSTRERIVKYGEYRVNGLAPTYRNANAAIIPMGKAPEQADHVSVHPPSASHGFRRRPSLPPKADSTSYKWFGVIFSQYQRV